MMKEITAKELQELRPKEFDTAYYSWLSNHDYCRDCVEEWFKEEIAEEGIDVDHIEVNQYNAKFQGRVWLEHFMKSTGMHEKYLALYEDVKLSRTYIRVTINHYHMDYQVGYAGIDTYPTGIFKHLDYESWCELVNEQTEECDYITDIEERCNYLCGKLFKALEQDYEDQTSTQAFIDHCEGNDITFSIEEEEDEIHN